MMESRPVVTTEVHFAQLLASNQNRVRDKALKKLGNWFESKSYGEGAFTEDSMLKVWKGLYYYFWNLDKPLIQEDKASVISKFMHNFKRVKYTFMYIDTFFQTMAREWFAIDRFRLEKFMMFVRKFLREAITFLKNTNWNIKVIKRFLTLFKRIVANPKSNSCPLGLKIHITDIYMDELARVGAEELTPKQTNYFLAPYCAVLAYCNDSTLLGCVRKDIFLYLINQDVDEEVFGHFPQLKFNPKSIEKLLTKWSEKDGIQKKNKNIIIGTIQNFWNFRRHLPHEEFVIDLKPRQAITKKMVDKAARSLLEEEMQFKEEKLQRKKKR